MHRSRRTISRILVHLSADPIPVLAHEQQHLARMSDETKEQIYLAALQRNNHQRQLLDTATRLGHVIPPQNQQLHQARSVSSGHPACLDHFFATDLSEEALSGKTARRIFMPTMTRRTVPHHNKVLLVTRPRKGVFRSWMAHEVEVEV